LALGAFSTTSRSVSISRCTRPPSRT
jgi:hypothetical protein